MIYDVKLEQGLCLLNFMTKFLNLTLTRMIMFCN